MKKIMFAALAVCLFITVAPAPSRAVEIGFGINGMYDIWLPAFKKLHTGETCGLIGKEIKSDDDGSLMLGPELGFYTEEWKVNFAVHFGVTRNALSYSSLVWDITVWHFIPGLPFNPYIAIGDEDTRRYDADIKIAKRLNNYFNLNFGARFNYGTGEGSQFRLYPLAGPWLNLGGDEYHFWQVGPEVGIGFNYTVKGFTVFLDVNGLINGGNNYLERRLIRPGLWPFLIPFEYETDLLGFGFDTDIGVNYYIEPAHMLIGIGFRWVGVVCASLSDDGSVLDLTHDDGWISGEWDHFYGFTFNVGFRF
ncbi:MAG: hypothetical protein JW807_02810 [Spirochaetes bacterium]|nr:hypothetical protein [Spirochaetota bacterium]